MDDLRYPVGTYEFNSPVAEADISRLIDEIAAAPAALRSAVSGLSHDQIETPYRPGGWTVRQVVHHLPDSHVNAYIRVKLALTEDEPTIKPYDEAAWARLADTVQTPVETSLSLLENIHERWVAILRSLSSSDWKRGYHHPEHGRLFTLDQVAAMYAWHGRHHVAHITALRARSGW